MTELTPEQSEAILDAAADGRVSDGAGATGELLVSLHSPGETTRVAPALTESGRTLTGRIARRTAIAASAAVLGLAGVAAAATGTAALLDSDEPEFVEVVDESDTVLDEEIVVDEEVVEDEASVGDDESEAEDESESDDETELDEESATDTTQGGHPAIDGVDPSDGLDDEELELACAGAENHGHYVSLVARDKTTETEGTHGERVSEAARSDCGKQDVEGDDSESDLDDGDDGDDSDTDTDTDDTDEIDADEDARGNSHRNGNGASNGNGHAKAKGKGHDKD